MKTIMFRPGSQAHKLITLLSVAGEISLSALSMIGNQQSMLNFIQDGKNECIVKVGKEKVKTRLFNVVKSNNVTRVHLTQRVYPFLKLIGGEEYYIKAFPNNHFESSYSHLDRRLRVAETIALCMAGGVEFRPYCLPKLQVNKFLSVAPREPMFYPIRDIKGIGGDDSDKQTRTTRMTGVLVNPVGSYAVYNLKDYVMRWSNTSELSGKSKVMDIMRLNYGLRTETQGIFLGNSYEIACENLEFIDMERFKKKRRYKISEEIRFDAVYANIHFIPLNEFGAKLLQLVTIPNFHTKMVSMLFPIQYRAPENATIDYDAQIEDRYILSFLSSDIARLMRFREGIRINKVKGEVVCYPEQVKMLKKYLGPEVEIRTIKIDKLLTDFKVQRRNLFEKL